MNYDTNKENLSREIVALLIKLARKDGQLDEKEFSFILQVCAAMDISAEEMREIQLNLDAYQFRPPQNEQERMTVLYYLLFCMKIDRQVTEEEKKLVQKMGFRLGFRQQMTDDLILSVQNHIEGKLPENELLQKLQKYMN
ncbi:tellurite resistance TerB family protein [Portibacter marinus]|uniref:tellurite resistance TerB family protein n=1 Tax=Portibacter marinus TaxID=2898660 RepID=UPI001F2C6500|nr:TerB family tellurite resistance protein [Portibacter marinus]